MSKCLRCMLRETKNNNSICDYCAEHFDIKPLSILEKAKMERELEKTLKYVRDLRKKIQKIQEDKKDEWRY